MASNDGSCHDRWSMANHAVTTCQWLAMMKHAMTAGQWPAVMILGL